MRATERQQGERERTHPPRVGKEERERQEQRGDDAEGPEVARGRPRDVGAQKPLLERDAVADRLLEERQPVRDEVVRGILGAASGRRVGRPRRRGPLRMGDHLPRHLELGSAGASRELLDGVTVAVAGREVQGAEVAVGSQRLVDEADAFEELGPVEGGHRPHAGDHVANRHVRGGLVLELDAHELVGRRSRRRELLVEPGERRHGLGILVTQTLDELDGERRRQCGGVKGSERERPGRLSGEAEELVRQGVGLVAGGTSLARSARRAAAGSPRARS